MQIILPNGAIHEVAAETKAVPSLSDVPQSEKPYDYAAESSQIALACWQDEETKDIPCNPTLAAAVAKRLAFFMQTAGRAYEGATYYRGIIDECGKHIGIQAFTADDGTIQEDVLAAKLPGLVKAQVELIRNEFGA